MIPGQRIVSRQFGIVTNDNLTDELAEKVIAAGLGQFIIINNLEVVDTTDTNFNYPLADSSKVTKKKKKINKTTDNEPEQ